MIEAPHDIVPQLRKGLSQLNSDGEIVVDRAALAMLAAVDGVSSVADLARVHGVDRTRDGLAELARIGAVDLDVRPFLSSSNESDDLATFEWEDDPRDQPDHGRIGPRSSWWFSGALTAAGFVWIVIAVGFLVSLTREDDGGNTRDQIAVIDEADLDAGHEAILPDRTDATSPGCDEETPCSDAVGAVPSAVETVATTPAATGTDPVAETPVTSVSTAETEAANRPDSDSGPPQVQQEERPEAATSLVAVAPTAETAARADAGPVPTPAARAAPRISLDEQFADNRRGWPNDSSSTAWLADGGYRMSARTPGNFVAIGVPGSGRVRSATLTGTFSKVGGPPGGGYGFVVRDQADSGRDGIQQRGQFYVLEAGDRGEIGIWRRDGDHWTDLVPWTPSQIVKTGSAPNELTVKIDGEHLIFLVNGVEVAHATDSAFTEGAVGLFVGGDGNDVLLHSLRIESQE